MKFKVGDEVTIIHNRTHQYRWYVGEVGIVEKIDRMLYCVRLRCKTVVVCEEYQMELTK